MLHLSTQELVQSIENSPLVNLDGLIYQEYPNFFGKKLLDQLSSDEKLNLAPLELQEEKQRSRVDYSETLMKKLKIFLSNSKITKAISTKFNTPLRFKSVDIWMDRTGYFLPPHTDDQRIKLALQIYLGTEINVGTSLFDGDNNVIKTFHYKFNSGYALLNNAVSLHGTEGTVAKNKLRRSLYVRYQ